MKNIMKNKKVLIILGVVIALLSVGFIVFAIIDSNNTPSIDNDDKNTENVGSEVKEETDSKLNIVDVNSNSRPVAVMINNLNAVRTYHSGLQDAYIVYEIIVEGGITRMMALFKDQNTARIGSVRSSRHYYLDYALENDAIYVHFGWSPQAESDIPKLNVKNINGLYDDAFWRDTNLNVSYEHTAFTSMEKILNTAKKKGYSLTSSKDLLLNYVTDEVDLSSHEESVVANSVDIKYSNYLTTSYIYNPKDKLYYRSVNDKSHSDYVTKKQYSTKNIIITYVDNKNIDGDSKGRQELDNIGTGVGFYITNGSCVPITWEKKSRTSQTVYKYKNGNEIDVNDGNTYIQIAPNNSAKIK